MANSIPSATAPEKALEEAISFLLAESLYRGLNATARALDLAIIALGLETKMRDQILCYLDKS
jgi:hypothetical protein